MVSRPVFNDATIASRSEELVTYIRQSADGPFFVNLLQEASADLAERRQITLLPLLKAIAGKLSLRLDEATDNPQHFEKVQWFIRYWNQELPRWAASECTVKGPGLEKPVTILDVISMTAAMNSGHL